MSERAFFLTVGVLAVALGLSLPAARRLHGARLHSERHLRVERWIYRAIGVDPDADQRWPVYVRASSPSPSVSVVALYLLQRVQEWLPST